MKGITHKRRCRTESSSRKYRSFLFLPGTPVCNRERMLTGLPHWEVELRDEQAS